jgi:hypothetical protein
VNKQLNKINLWFASSILIGLAQPTSEVDVEALKQGTFYFFANSPSNIKTLGLSGCVNNWEEHPERLEGLLAAIAKTPIKHSLQEIDVGHSGVSKEQVREMVYRLGFAGVEEIIVYFWEY